jgi:acetyl esterase/lipase
MTARTRVSSLYLSTIGAFILLLASASQVPAADSPAFARQEDVIYGRKDGMALTMDVLTPKDKANGAAVVWVISGGFFSSHEAINPGFVLEFLKRGYTVFAVVHGSQPRYTIPDAVADMNRSVRYIRCRAKEFKIDPQRIGITGGSAGGHLSLMIGTAGGLGNPKAADPVERVSSRVQAVACFFPPTDFLNYGKEGVVALGTGTLAGFKAPFEFRELDPKTKAYVPISDPARRLEIGRQISPLTHVSKDSAPTLIIHGDADMLVPIQQSQRIMARFKEVGVPAELVVKHGYGHGWLTITLDIPTIADWFDKHLLEANR